ncbi:MAG: ribonuclease J [Candidatus Pacebacteria bacterium]|nr:ribonuclease J [Candidatus Paceibacterota bacterium]
MNTEKNTRDSKKESPKGVEKRKITPRKNNRNRSHNNKGRGRGRNHTNKVNHRNTKTHNKQPIPEIQGNDVRVIPIGGVEQVGQNMNIIETKDDIFVVDIGIQFSSEEETPGVDYIIPNIKYLLERKDKIRGVFVTHGHLDHIGAFPYIIDQLGYPTVYCGLLTKWMIDKRNAEFPHLKSLNYEIVEAGQRITVGPNNMKVKIFAVTHSIPDAIGFSFETTEGNIILAGDTKLEHVDTEPVQREKDAYGKLERDDQKNLLFLSDSTGAEQMGWSKNEADIIENIIDMIGEAKGRVFLGTFASQIVRITAIMEGAHAHGKKIVLEGRSMKTNVDICIKSGRWVPPKGLIISADEAQNHAPDKLVYLLTGSQGEEFAALMRISTRKHPKIKFTDRDTVILSSSVIPGNAKSVRKLKDNLARNDLRIVEYQTSEIHASGHGKQDELLWIEKTVGAKFFMPVHGHLSMLKAHMHAVMDKNGVAKENIIIPENGSIIDLNKDGFKVHKAKAPNNVTVVEGFRVGDIQDVVVRDRKTLTKEGIFVVIATIDPKTGKMRKSPDIISRGFVYLRDSQELIQGARNLVKQSITKNTKGKNPVDFDTIKKRISDDLGRYLVQNTGKRPIIIPVVLGV